MIDRYGPMGRAMGLRQLMDRMLEDAFVMPREGGGNEGWGGPGVDVYEDDSNLVVEAQLPGLQPDQIEVHVERDVLKISGTTGSNQERQGRSYLLRERRAGRFQPQPAVTRQLPH